MLKRSKVLGIAFALHINYCSYYCGRVFVKVNVKAPMRGQVCSGLWFDGMDSIVSEKVVRGRCSWSVCTHSQEEKSGEWCSGDYLIF